MFLEPGEGPQQGGMVLLGLKAGYHHQANRCAPWISPQLGGDVRHAVMHGNHPILTDQARLECKPTIKLRYRDDLAGKEAYEALDLAIDRRLACRDPGGKVPTVGREQGGDAEGSGGQPPQDSRLGGVGRQQVRAEVPQDPADLSQRSQVANRINRAREMSENYGGGILPAKLIDEWPGSTGDNGRRIALGPYCRGKVPHVDLNAPNPIRPSHEVRHPHPRTCLSRLGVILAVDARPGRPPVGDRGPKYIAAGNWAVVVRAGAFPGCILWRQYVSISIQYFVTIENCNIL